MEEWLNKMVEEEQMKVQLWRRKDEEEQMKKEG